MFFTIVSRKIGQIRFIRRIIINGPSFKIIGCVTDWNAYNAKKISNHCSVNENFQKHAVAMFYPLNW